MENSIEAKGGNQNNTMIIVVGIVVVVAIVGFFVTRSKSEVGITTSPVTADKPSDSEESTSSSGGAINSTDRMERIEDKVMTDEADSEVEVISIEAGAFYYKPNVITVKQGQKVKIVMNSVDMQHDFKIDELEVSIPVTKSGNSATVEFIADKVGEYQFYCSVGQHRAKGQVGTLIIE